jgi:pyruvate formate lyase activating enzyme
MIRLGSVASTVVFSSVDGPGNRFVVFMQGCNFDCIACHNPQTIPVFLHGQERHRYHRSVTGLVYEMRRAAPFLSGVTVSGGEATLQAPFVRDLFLAVKTDPELRGLTCFIDSNGSCDDATWDLLEPVTDGVMIDLKCFDDDIHRQMTGQSNAPVLASIERLHASGKLYEVRLLLLAGINDDPALLRRTAEWLAAIDPTMRVKLIGFRAHGVRPHDPPLTEPAPDELDAAAALLGDVSRFDLCVV